MSFDERLILSKEDRGDILRSEHLVRYKFVAKFVKNKKVLDIACGTGYGTKILAESGAGEVVGMDRDTDSVKVASLKSSLNNLSYKAGDATAIPVPDKSFDAAVSFETIEHLNARDQDKFVSELSRVVSEDGLVFVSTPNLNVFQNKNPYHIKELSRNEFKEILKKYFSSVVIMEQNNGVASFVRPAGDKTIKETEITSSSEPLYFVAVCSHQEINNLEGEGVGSLSVAVYDRMKNNPILKLSDKIYPLFKKFFRK